MILTTDMAEYLENKGIGKFGVDIFEGNEPTSPDNCITLYEYAGETPDLIAGYDYPNLQVRVRNTNYNKGRELLQRIQDILQEIGNELGEDDNLVSGLIINSTFYSAIRPIQGIIPLGTDDNKRVIIVQNFKINKQRKAVI